MSTETVESPILTGSANEDLEHYYCLCSPDISMCGIDLTGQDDCPDDCGHVDCVVCSDEDTPCRTCGCTNNQWCDLCDGRPVIP